MNGIYLYPAKFHTTKEGFCVCFPDLQDCNAQGVTLKEAAFAAKTALGTYLLAQKIEGKDFPEPSSPGGFTLENGEFAALIEVDLAEFLRKNGAHAVKKTLSIPAWLNALAEKESVNFSQVLQKALKDALGLEG